MTQLSIYSPNADSKYEIPSTDKIAQCNEALATLFFPYSLQDQKIQQIKSEYGAWLIEASNPQRNLTMRIDHFVDSLKTETLTTEFTSTLATISMGSTLDRRQAQLLAYFHLSRFCEYRAGLSALELDQVIDVKLAQPNSKHDRSKQDLIIECPEGERFLQVKARAGKDSRVSKDTPTLRNVFKMKFSQVTAQIKALLKNSNVAFN